MRPAAALAALLILGACNPAATPIGDPSQAKFAGLDAAELQWRKDILANDKLCKSTVDEQKCAKFEVACKSEREVTAADQAKGVTAHVVAMMTFDGFDPNFKQSQSGTRAAEFTKTTKGWTRAEHGPVYMQSCGDMK